jgi:molybdopterin molybdotransferase
MDGYAVRAADTHGAGESLPAFFRVVGEVAMGRAADISLQNGEAAIVHTGGMIPDAADAVVQVEHTQTVGLPAGDRFPFEIEVSRAVAGGQNVIQVGEDLNSAAEVLPAGALIRPQDVGGLLALGIMEIAVALRPLVMILATGDEVVPPDMTPGPGRIRDINSYTIAAQCIKAGGVPRVRGIVPDDMTALRSAAGQALAEADMLVMSAGSSVSVRDMTVQVIDGLGEPGVLLHGVATRPGKPTIVGAVDGKPVLGLPGNPVSAMIQFDMFGVPAIYRLLGLSGATPRNRIWAKLAKNVPSESGREDYVPARLEETATGLMATPVFGKSNLIYTLVKADGLIKVPLNRGGLSAGEMVEVSLF